jgi:hypothetical protein
VQHYPIQYEVGEAILRYLTKGRPRCLCRHVFVTLHPPYRPLRASSIFDMSCTPIQVTHFGNPNGVTEQDYFAQRDRLIQNGWAFRWEAFDELPIGVAN